MGTFFEPKENADPFSLVLLAMWNSLMDHKPLSKIVKPGNMIKRIGEGGGRVTKDIVQDADAPELDIIPVGVDDMELFKTSCAAEVNQSYQIGLDTGDRNLGDAFFPLKWELIRAVAKITQKPWPYSWVKAVRLINISEEENDSRERTGWTGLINVTVQMQFDRKLHLFADIPNLTK